MDWHGDWVRDGMWLLWVALALVAAFTVIARWFDRGKKRK